MLVLNAGSRYVNELTFSHDGKRLAAKTAKPMVYWPRLDTSKPVVLDPKGARGFGFVAGSNYAIVLPQHRGPLTLSLEGEEVDRFPSRSVVQSLVCSPTSPLVVVRMWRLGQLSGWRIGEAGEWEHLWDQKGGTSMPPLFTPDGARVCHIELTAPRPQNQFPMQLKWHHPETGKLAVSKRLPSNIPVYLEYQPTFSPDARNLAKCFQKEIAIVDVATAEPTARIIKNDNRKEFTGIAFHPSGRFLAATSNDATVKLYDTTTWSVAKTFTWNIGRMRSIAFSPDGTLAAAGSDTGRVVVWDVDL